MGSIEEFKQVLLEKDRNFTDGKFHLCEKLYVPEQYVTEKSISDFSYQIPIEVDLEDGSTETVKKDINLWSQHGPYYSFHRGDLVKLQEIWPMIDDPGMLVDHRSIKPLGIDLCLIPDFNYRTYETGDQRTALIELLNPPIGGIFQAFPSFGKTVIMTLLTMSHGYTAILLAHSSNLLAQFEKTVRGITNINDLEKDLGKKLISKLYKSKPLPLIATSTFQYLLKNPVYANEISDKFGIVMVDESHHIGGEGFTMSFVNFNPLLRYGFSATSFRKDNLDVVFNDTLGPIRVNIPEPPSNTTAYICDTGVKIPTKYAYSKFPVNLAYGFIAKCEERNQLIAKNALNDVIDGHLVIILVYRVVQIDNIYNELKTILKNHPYGMRINEVERLYSKVKDADLDEMKERLTSRESSIVITTAQLFGEGSDIPALSAMHFAFPMSQEKNLKQIYGRIIRKFKGKKDPKMTYYRDSGLPHILGMAKGWINRMKDFGVTIIDPRESTDTKLTLWKK